jgi:hypothetical protein
MERVHNSLPMAVHRKPHKGFHSMGQYLDKRIDPARQKKVKLENICCTAPYSSKLMNLDGKIVEKRKLKGQKIK